RWVSSAKIPGRKAAPDGRRVRFGDGIEDRQVHGWQLIHRRVLSQLHRHQPPAPAAVVASEEPLRGGHLLEAFQHGTRARTANTAGVTAWAGLPAPAFAAVGGGSLDRQVFYCLRRGIAHPS